MTRRHPCRRQDGEPKIKYKDPANAKAEADRMMREFNDLFRSYQCPSCLSHHVGRHGKNSMLFRQKRRIYESEALIELGERALANLLMGDGMGLDQRLKAAERRRT